MNSAVLAPHLFAVMGFVTLVFILAQPAYSEERRFLYSEGLTFSFEEQDRTLAERLWPLLIEDRREIMERLQLYPPGALRVTLAPTQDAFERATEGVLPEALGVYFPNTRSVVLRSPRSRAGGEWDLRGVARHELAHGILDLAIDQPIPRWLNEGLAILVADELSFLDDSQLTWLAFRERLIPLPLLMATFPEGEGELGLAYSQAASFARFLLRRDGMEGLRHLLAAMAEGRSAERAFSSTYGASLPELEQSWAEDLNGRFSWFALFTPITIFGGIGAPLVLLAWLRRHIEGRRRLRAWALEADLPGNADQTGAAAPGTSAAGEAPVPGPLRPSEAGRRGISSRIWRRPESPS